MLFRSIQHQLFDPGKAGGNDPYSPDPNIPTQVINPTGQDVTGGVLYLGRYAPAQGLTYSWALGQAKTTTTVKTWEQNTFNLIGWDWTFGKNPNIPPISVNTTYTQPSPLLQGQALLPTTPSSWSSSTGFATSYKKVSIGDPQTTVDNWTTGGGWLRTKTYHTQTTTIQAEKDIWMDTIKADWPIDVGFLARNAANSGSVKIESKGGIQLNRGATASGGLDLNSSAGDIEVNQLLVDPGTPLALRAPAGAVTLQLGSTTAQGGSLDLQAQAGGDLSVAMIANQGHTAALRPGEIGRAHV